MGRQGPLRGYNDEPTKLTATACAGTTTVHNNEARGWTDKQTMMETTPATPWPGPHWQGREREVGIGLTPKKWRPRVRQRPSQNSGFATGNTEENFWSSDDQP